MALSDYNQQALATAYASGWLTDDQYHAAVAGLEAMPHLQAPAFLQEQSIINESQAEGLRQALAEFEAAQAAAPAPRPRPPPPPRSSRRGTRSVHGTHRRRAAGTARRAAQFAEPPATARL